ncbi:hypothetical protein FA95DRAFT_1566827 [Auriscalpium vulgare]|uniref:Uncharacterized protein n=1 Tax=Auriscalpium vulgare TaxID=40419 RepID=A0ACB8R7L8_9AGAM|nr:hypothetical protein FA95DRAFT_1566827 [Auriscalpium vulgare]
MGSSRTRRAGYQDLHDSEIRLEESSSTPPRYLLSRRAIRIPPAFDTASSEPLHTSRSLTSSRTPGEIS